MLWEVDFVASSVCVSDQREKKATSVSQFEGKKRGGSVVHLQAPALSTVTTTRNKQNQRDRKFGQTPVSQGSRAMWRRFCSPFAKLASIYFYLLIAALVCDKFADTNSNER